MGCTILKLVKVLEVSLFDDEKKARAVESSRLHGPTNTCPREACMMDMGPFLVVAPETIYRCFFKAVVLGSTTTSVDDPLKLFTAGCSSSGA